MTDRTGGIVGRVGLVLFAYFGSAAQADGPSPVPATLTGIPQLEQLRASEQLSLANVELSAGVFADLELSRFEAFAPGARVIVMQADGAIEIPPPALAVFSGVVRGAADSRAFLSVSEFGTYGFVLHNSRTYVISSGPADSGWPTISADLAALPLAPGGVDFECHSASLPDVAAPASPPSGSTRGAVPCRTARLAIETDNEFTNNLFSGNPTASAAYVGTLIGAVSSIYTRDVNTRMQVGYLRLWTTATDPWTGSDTGAQLDEFLNHWNANMRDVPRHLAHFLSGRGLGGGIAYLSVVCHPDYGYGVSANLGGFFPHPIQNNSGANWDLMVTAHELGHNFGAPHTHDLTPPIDNCAGGDCSISPNGTIMSYCHLCGGGLANVRMELHARNVNENILPHLNGVCALTGAPFDGHSLSFDGINDVATVPGFGGIAPTNEVTIEFWVYARQAAGHSVFGMSTDITTNRFQAHVPYSDGRVYWDFGNISAGGRLSYQPPVSIVGAWHHFALVSSQSGNYMRIYRNGVQEAQRTGMRVFAQNSSWNLLLGGLGTGSRFNGRLDEVRIWNRARTATEIAQSWNATLDPTGQSGLLAYWRFEEGSGATTEDIAGASDATLNLPTWYAEDDCVNDTGACCFLNGACLLVTATACDDFGGTYQGNGTTCSAGACPAVGGCCLPQSAGVCSILFESECIANGGTFIGEGSNCDTAGALPGFAVRLDGTNDYVSVSGFGGIAPTSEVTVEFWQFTDDLLNRSSFGMSTDSVSNRFQAHVPWGDGQVYWDFGDINNGGRLQYTPPAPLVGRWTHFAFVASQAGNHMRIYRNGVLEAEKVGMNAFERMSTWALRIGALSNSRFFKGRIDEFRVWSRARSAAEIAETYGQTVNPATQTGLIGYWRLNDGAGTVADDASVSGRNGALINGATWASTDGCDTCVPDLDNNGAVDLSDLSTMLANFGIASGASRSQGDMNGDGDVDIEDVATLLASFGTTCP